MNRRNLAPSSRNGKHGGFTSRPNVPDGNVEKTGNERNKVLFSEAQYTSLLTNVIGSNYPPSASLWIVDPGNSCHTTVIKSSLVWYTATSGRNIEMGAKAKAQVCCFVDVIFYLKIAIVSYRCRFQDVLHIPDIGYSLLSVSETDMEGFSTPFENKLCKATNGERTIVKGCIRCLLYKSGITKGIFALWQALRHYPFWHESLSIASERGIVQMSKSSTV